MKLHVKREQLLICVCVEIVSPDALGKRCCSFLVRDFGQTNITFIHKPHVLHGITDGWFGLGLTGRTFMSAQHRC